MRLDHKIRVLWLLVWIIHASEMLNFALVNKLVETLDITLPADLKGTLDIYFNKIADFPPCPCAGFAIGGNGSRDADNAIARQQAAYKGDTLDIGIAVLATKAKPLTQVRTHSITIQYLNTLSPRL